LKVASVRQIVLPSSPAGESFAIENWNIVILDGTAADGRPATIALDRPNADETPEVGETVSLFDVPGATGSVIRLSYGHEEGYQRLHPQPPSLPPGAR
jgi:hypothetical protein